MSVAAKHYKKDLGACVPKVNVVARMPVQACPILYPFIFFASFARSSVSYYLHPKA
jgi:hypothetical protein